MRERVVAGFAMLETGGDAGSERRLVGIDDGVGKTARARDRATSDCSCAGSDRWDGAGNP
jgi:hypothetical protein